MMDFHTGAKPWRLNVAGNVRVLVGHALRGIKEQQHDVGIFYRLQGLHYRKLLDCFENFAFATETGRVDQLELLPVALEGNGNRVASSTGQIERDQTLFAQPGIYQRRFTDVGATRHCKPDN